jgi:hypothetical protein
MYNKFRILLFLAILALQPGTALAGEFSRQGWYAGLNYAHGFNFITEAIDAKTGGKLNTSNTGGFTARGGYRLFSWFAIEGEYEFMSGFKTDGALGSTDIRTNSIMVSPKFLLPFWRVQPYLLVGFGAQHSNLDFTSDTRLVDDSSVSSWKAALRPALGIDFYITPKLLANLELAGVFVPGKFENQDITLNDPIYLSLGAGLQYRF